MLAFWRHGYEGTSVAALTAAMGITPPSLYTAFGDKQRLFLEAARLYAGDPQEMAERMDAAPSARQAAADFLRSSAAIFTDPTTPPGCLLASATASGPPTSADVQRAVAELRRATRQVLVTRIKRDLTAGLLPTSTDPAALADLVMALTQGMSVLARDGAPYEALVALADQAITGWPDGAPSG